MSVKVGLSGMLFGLVAMAVVPLVRPSARLVYNPTDSAPRGWYVVASQAPIRLGDYIVTQLPHAAADLAAARGYLPPGLPVLKRVAALAGQWVCVHENVVYVDGNPLARTLAADGVGRVLLPAPICRVLDADELFLLNPKHSGSFDSRYFGPVRLGAVQGRATPVWVWTGR